MSYLEKSKPVIYIIIAFVFSLSFTIVLDLFVNISSDAETLVFCVVFVTVSIALFLLVKDVSENDSSAKYVYLNIRNINFQKFLSAMGALFFGGIAATIASQTIAVSFITSDALRTNSVVSDRYKSLQEKQSNAYDEAVKNINTEGMRDSYLKTATNIGEQLASIEKSDSLQRENEAKLTRQSIDGAFLFDYFSNIFVRIGTIMIVLFLFSVCIWEYRRLDRRCLEFQELLLAMKLRSEGIDFNEIRGGRDVARIDDTPKRNDKNDKDTLFAREYTSGVSTTFTNFAGTAKSLLSRNQQDDK